MTMAKTYVKLFFDEKIVVTRNTECCFKNCSTDIHNNDRFIDLLTEVYATMSDGSEFTITISDDLQYENGYSEENYVVIHMKRSDDLMLISSMYFNNDAGGIFGWTAVTRDEFSPIEIDMRNFTITYHYLYELRDKYDDCGPTTLEGVFRDIYEDWTDGFTVFKCGDDGIIIEEPIEHS